MTSHTYKRELLALTTSPIKMKPFKCPWWINLYSIKVPNTLSLVLKADKEVDWDTLKSGGKIESLCPKRTGSILFSSISPVSICTIILPYPSQSFSPSGYSAPLTQPVSFASLLSPYPPLWQLFPTLLYCALFSFILSWYQYHSFLFFPLLPRDRRHWEHGSCLSFTRVFFFAHALSIAPFFSFSLELGTSCGSILCAISSFFFLFVSHFPRWGGEDTHTHTQFQLISSTERQRVRSGAT